MICSAASRINPLSDAKAAGLSTAVRAGCATATASARIVSHAARRFLGVVTVGTLSEALQAHTLQRSSSEHS